MAVMLHVSVFLLIMMIDEETTENLNATTMMKEIPCFWRV